MISADLPPIRGALDLLIGVAFFLVVAVDLPLSVVFFLWFLTVLVVPLLLLLLMVACQQQAVI